MPDVRRGDRPRAHDFLARNRGGGLFSETVNQRIAAWLCVLAYRLRLAPTVLTLANLAIGLAASVMLVVLADSSAAGQVPAAAVGLVALLAWQFAYCLDCADGQLARVTGRASPAGQRVDILADVAQQISVVAAVSAVARAFTPDVPVWLVAAFAGTWMVNLVTSVLQQGAAAGSLVSDRSRAVRLIKLVRDYGAVIAVIGLVLTIRPAWTVWLMVVFTAINAAFLFASIAVAARRSLQPS